MMNIYKETIPQLGGYLINDTDLHLNRIEIYLQEIARREPLYFQQRAIDDKEPGYATDDYKDFYYKVTNSIQLIRFFKLYRLFANNNLF